MKIIEIEHEHKQLLCNSSHKHDNNGSFSGAHMICNGFFLSLDTFHPRCVYELHNRFSLHWILSLAPRPIFDRCAYKFRCTMLFSAKEQKKTKKNAALCGMNRTGIYVEWNLTQKPFYFQIIYRLFESNNKTFKNSFWVVFCSFLLRIWIVFLVSTSPSHAHISFFFGCLRIFPQFFDRSVVYL